MVCMWKVIGARKLMLNVSVEHGHRATPFAVARPSPSVTDRVTGCPGDSRSIRDPPVVLSESRDEVALTSRTGTAGFLQSKLSCRAP